MEFIQPIPFDEAVQKLGEKSIIGSQLTSAEWQDVPVELRDRAFFSSQVESIQVLQRARDAINDFLSGNKITSDNGETLLATGSRAAFVDQMQTFLTANGFERSTGGVRDITSERRLGLIFDTQTRQAHDFGYWKQGQDPAVLKEFPAQRFIRVIDVKEPRQNHAIYQDQVFLKNDPIWARVINADFGVPWGPWGWGCGHDVEDVDQNEARKLGVLKPGQTVQPMDYKFNRGLQASTKRLDPDLIEKLKQAFGKQVIFEGDTVRWAAGGPPQVELPAAPVPVVAAANQSPVSDALQIRVAGKLRDQVKAAIETIDQVHDDGVLPVIPIRSTKASYLGCLQPVLSGNGITAGNIAVRASGTWPALTTVHEIGHFLDLDAIGAKGDFSTKRGDPDMKRVLEAAERTAAVQGLRAKLAESRGFEQIRAYKYFLTPWEIWARAYAQFIAERSGSEMLQKQLAACRDDLKFRQWETDDFKPVAEAIEVLFKKLGWMP
jgi:hypothetical protein